jgi:peroxiredoxin
MISQILLNRNSLFLSLGILCYGMIPQQLAAKSAPKEEKKPAVADPAKAITFSDDYVHSWMKFPPLSGIDVNTEKSRSFTAKAGTVLAVFFVASWSLPCQKMMANLQKLNDKFKQLHTQFVFVFSHDTLSDARGFIEEHNLSIDAILADHKILKDFHNPELPSVYLSDRRGWLSQRFISLDDKKMEELQNSLNLMTAF